MTQCPRTNCKNEAIVHRMLGVLPCEEHQLQDSAVPHRKFEFANLSKLHRVQEQRDLGGKDLLQPYHKNKPNPDFFKAYPDRVDEYGVRGELAKL